MNDLIQDDTARNITLAELNSNIREARRLRSEEIHRLLGVANRWVRKEFKEFGRGVKHVGAWLVRRLEAMTERQRQTRAPYD